MSAADTLKLLLAAKPHRPDSAWKVVKVGGKFCVTNINSRTKGTKDGEETKGSAGSRCHDTEDAADRQMKAMYASSSESYRERLVRKSKAKK